MLNIAYSNTLSFLKRQKEVFILLWICYASLYLGRVNFSAALPMIITDFSITKTQAGIITTAFFWAYAAGQFINGYCGNFRNAKIYIGICLLVSANLNLLMAFPNSLMCMAIIWGGNGFFQSIGWPSTVKTVNKWYPENKIGTISGILANSYIIGSSISIVIAGYISNKFGWHFAFIVPYFILLAISILWWFKGSSSPELENYPPVNVTKTAADEKTYTWFGNQRVWLAAGSLCCLNLVRYGFLAWAPLFLFETYHINVFRAAWSSAILPIAGGVGAFCMGKVSDRGLVKKREIIIFISLLSTAFLIFLFNLVLKAHHFYICLLFLMLIGFFLYSAHALIVVAIPMDLGRKQDTSVITGFIDGWGYIGAGLEGFSTGWLVDKFGWNSGIYLWLGGAVIATSFSAIMLCKKE